MSESRSICRPREDIRLVSLGHEHAATTLAWLRDPDLAADLGLRREPTEEGTRAWIEEARADDGSEPLAILVGGRHAGNVVLDRIDRHVEEARLSVYVGPGQQGGGVGSSGVLLALAHAFGPLGLNRVWLTVHVQNERAARCYRRVGFVEEGLLRESFLLRGELVSSRLMAVLRRDFAPLHRA